MSDGGHITKKICETRAELRKKRRNCKKEERSMLYKVCCVRQLIINNLFGQLMSHVKL